MRRSSFVGALTAVAIGGVLAFGIKGTFKDLDTHVVGLILMLAGIADLVVRFAIANSPLFSTTTADVAAVIEPLGEPVLDVFGNPITAAAPPTTVLTPPTPITPVVPVNPVTPVVPSGLAVPSAYSTQELPVILEAPVPATQARVEAQAAAMSPAQRAAVAAAEAASGDQVVRTVGEHGMDESLVPISPLTGRPVRTRRRRRRGV